MNTSELRIKKARKPRVIYPRKVKVGTVTITIYQRKTPAGNMGYVIPKDIGGKRTFESFKDEEAAYQAAVALANHVSSGNTQAAQLSNQQAIEYSYAVEALRPLGLTVGETVNKVVECSKVVPFGKLLEAAQFYALRHKQTEPKSITKVVEELLRVKKAEDLSSRYLEDLKFRLTKFSDSFGTLRACSVTKAEIQPWLEKFKGQSYMNFRRVLHLLFEFAVSHGYAIDNPVLQVRSVKVRTGDIEIYTPEELVRLLNSAVQLRDSDETDLPDFVPCLAIGAFSGLRSAEIERLEWKDIRLPKDKENRVIVVGADKAKTASRRIVGIPDNLAEWLADYSSKKGKVWEGTHEEFYDAQQAVAANTAEVNPETGARLVEPLKWKANALRHSCATYRVALTANVNLVALELGNSAPVVHRHYKELATKSDAERWFNIRPQICPQVVPNQPANILALPEAVNQ